MTQHTKNSRLLQVTHALKILAPQIAINQFAAGGDIRPVNLESGEVLSSLPFTQIELDIALSDVKALQNLIAPRPGNLTLLAIGPGQVQPLLSLGIELIHSYNAVAICHFSLVDIFVSKSLLKYLFDLGFVPLSGPSHSADEVGKDGDLDVQVFMQCSHLSSSSNIGICSHRTRGVVSMSSLGSNGRFANQLFQYAFLKLYSIRHGAKCAVPIWDGQNQFGLDDYPLPEPPLPELRFFAFDDDDRALWTMPQAPLNVDFFGYFQELPVCWALQRPTLRRLFALPKSFQNQIGEAVLNITDNGRRPLVCLHIRRGDYVTLANEGLEWYRPVPANAYREFIDLCSAELSNPVFYLASDELETVIDELGYNNFKTIRDLALDKVPAYIVDFEVLRTAHTLAIANSSFSRMASLLASDDQKAYLFEPENGGFKLYESWQDPNFWKRYEGPNTSQLVSGTGEYRVLMRGIEARRQRGQALAQVDAAKLERIELDHEVRKPATSTELSRSYVETAVALIRAEADVHYSQTLEAITRDKSQTDQLLIQLQTDVAQLKCEAIEQARMPSLLTPLVYGALGLMIGLLSLLARLLGRRVSLALYHMRTLLRHRQYREFWELIRRWFGRFPLVRRGNVHALVAKLKGEHINVRSSFIGREGRLQIKQPFCYPEDGATYLLSIVIPCYNYGNYIREAVKSAKNQTLAGVEVIIVENGSTDQETLDVVKSIEAEGGVKVVWLSPNQGLPNARNAGFEIAGGEYICSLDADDMFEPTYTEKAVSVLESDHSIGFAYSWVQLFGDKNGVWETQDFDPDTAILDNQTSVSAIFRRDDWLLAGGYDGSMHNGYDDWEFWLRLAALGRRGKAIKEPLLMHRKHASNMTGNAHLKRGHWMVELAKKNPVLFENAQLRKRLTRLAPITGGIEMFSAMRQAIYSGNTLERPHMLVVVPWLPFGGGAEILLHDILAEFACKWRLSIVTTVPANHDMLPAFAHLTQEIYQLDQFLPKEAWLDFLSMLVATRQTKVLFSSGSQFFYDSVAELKKRHSALRTISVLHNDLPTGHLKSALRVRNEIDTHLAISKTIALSLSAAGVAEHNIAVIENGVDNEGVFHPARLDRGAARAALGIIGNRPVLAFVGRLSEEKRPLEFLGIINQLRDIEGLTAIIIGEGHLSAEVDRVISAQNLQEIVSRLSHRDRNQMAEIYAAADVLLLTSTIEGQPLVVLEALATGCPVAATRVGDLARIISHGSNGFLVDPAYPLEIADYVRRYLVLPPENQSQMRSNAVSSVVAAGMTKRQMVERYAALCNVAEFGLMTSDANSVGVNNK